MEPRLFGPADHRTAPNDLLHLYYILIAPKSTIIRYVPMSREIIQGTAGFSPLQLPAQQMPIAQLVTGTLLWKF